MPQFDLNLLNIQTVFIYVFLVSYLFYIKEINFYFFYLSKLASQLNLHLIFMKFRILFFFNISVNKNIKISKNTNLMSKFNSKQKSKYSTINNNSSKSNLTAKNKGLPSEDVIFCNKKIDIKILSPEEAKLLESKAIPFESTISGDVNIIEDFIPNKLSTWDRIRTSINSNFLLNLTKYLLFFLFYYIFLIFHLIVHYFFFFLYIICSYFTDLPIFKLNVKYQNFKLDNINIHELLSIDQLSFFKKIIVLVWLFFIDLPITIMLILIFILLNLILTLFCFIISLFTIPIKLMLKTSTIIDPFKYLKNLSFLIIIFFFINFFYILINVFFPALKFFYIFIGFFIIISCINYKSKKNKVLLSWNIFNFFLLISDVFRYRLRKLINSSKLKIEDAYFMLVDCNFFYHISSFNSKIKKIVLKFLTFFKKESHDDNNDNDNDNDDNDDNDEFNLNLLLKKVDSNTEKKTTDPKNSVNFYRNQTIKRFYMKKLVPINTFLGHNSEFFNKPSILTKQLNSINFENNISNINNYVKTKGILVKSNSLDFETDDVKINHLSNFRLDIAKKKLYMFATHNDGSKCDYVSELNSNLNNTESNFYFTKDNQIIKINLDFSNLKINNFSVFKGVFLFEDFKIGTFKDPYFFSNCLHLSDKKMDNHHFFSFLYTCLNNSTGELTVRSAVITATSNTNSSQYGDLFTKNYNNTKSYKENIYNYKKPYSVPFDKLRDFDLNDFKKINFKNNSLDLTKYNSKYCIVVKNYLIDKLNLNKNLIFTDPITGQKHTFLVVGDYKDYFNNNRFMITKLLTDPSISTEMRFKLLSLFCENEDFIFTSYYNTSNTKDKFDVTESSPQELELIK